MYLTWKYAICTLIGLLYVSMIKQFVPLQIIPGISQECWIDLCYLFLVYYQGEIVNSEGLGSNIRNYFPCSSIIGLFGSYIWGFDPFNDQKYWYWKGFGNICFFLSIPLPLLYSVLDAKGCVYVVILLTIFW